MALGTVVDSNVLSYPVLVFMKEQGVAVEQGRAYPRTSGEAEPVLGRQARQSLPSAVGRGRVCPQTSSEAEPTFGGQTRQS